jgi:hypothetical protein
MCAVKIPAYSCEVFRNGLTSKTNALVYPFLTAATNIDNYFSI